MTFACVGVNVALLVTLAIGRTRSNCLARACLARACLARACLARACLARACLARACLARACLARDSSETRTGH